MLCVNAKMTSGSRMAPYGRMTAQRTVPALGGQSPRPERKQKTPSLDSRPNPARPESQLIWWPLDGLDPDYLGNLLLQHALDSVGEGELRHRTSPTRALKLHLHDALVSDADQSNVTAVGLERRPNLIEYRLNSVLVHSDPPQRFYIRITRHQWAARLCFSENCTTILTYPVNIEQQQPESPAIRKSRRMYSAASYSPTAYAAVPSALEGLTTGFGMGPGVPPPQ